jgi:hypothetical protein
MDGASLAPPRWSRPLVHSPRLAADGPLAPDIDEAFRYPTDR